MIDRSLAGTGNYDPQRAAIVQALLEQQQQQQGGPQSGPGWETFNGPRAFAGAPGGGGGVPGTANYTGGFPAGGFPAGFRGGFFNPNGIVGEVNPASDFSGDPDAGAGAAISGGGWGGLNGPGGFATGQGTMSSGTPSGNAIADAATNGISAGNLGYGSLGNLGDLTGSNNPGMNMGPLGGFPSLANESDLAGTLGTPQGWAVTNPSPSVSISISTPGNPSVSQDPGGSVTSGGDAGNASGVMGGEGVGGMTGFGGTVGQGMGLGADVGMGGSDAGSGGVGGAAVGSAGDVGGGPGSGGLGAGGATGMGASGDVGSDAGGAAAGSSSGDGGGAGGGGSGK